MKNKIGFTLIELIVVMGIIGFLATMVLFGLSKSSASGRDAKREQIMTGLQTSLERFYSDFKHYPITGDAIPGSGSTSVSSNDFDGMMTELGQNNYTTISNFIDPSGGLIFGSLGTNRYTYTSNWNQNINNLGSACGLSGLNITYSLNTYSGVSIQYVYYTPDGQSYTLCLVKESGGTVNFKSP